jgi:hypothetical protein
LVPNLRKRPDLLPIADISAVLKIVLLHFDRSWITVVPVEAEEERDGD